MFFAIFAVFVDVEELDATVIVVFDPAAKPLFKFLDIGVVEVVVIGRKRFVIGECEERVLIMERSVQDAAGSEFGGFAFAAEDAFSAVEDAIVDKFEARR